MTKKYTIYCDLDGVLTDYDGKIKSVFPGYKSSIQHEQMVSMIKTIPNFWTTLKWLPDGKKLWEFLKPYNPIILSAPLPGDESSWQGKRDWIKKELGHMAPYKLVWRHLKKVFASPTSILIDDMGINIQEWREAGGIGILHHNTNDTIAKLRAILQN